MTTPRARLGRASERLAQRVLASHGYVIERTNVRFPVGELDIVARDGQTLCFIEVRSTSSSEWGGPLASIDERKRRRLIRAARWYLGDQAVLPPEIRFDVLAVDWHAGRAPTVELVRGAFDAS